MSLSNLMEFEKDLGFYRDEKEAARAYDKASLKFWGDFGYQNGV